MLVGSSALGPEDVSAMGGKLLAASEYYRLVDSSALGIIAAAGHIAGCHDGPCCGVLLRYECPGGRLLATSEYYKLVVSSALVLGRLLATSEYYKLVVSSALVLRHECHGWRLLATSEYYKLVVSSALVLTPIEYYKIVDPRAFNIIAAAGHIAGCRAGPCCWVLPRHGCHGGRLLNLSEYYKLMDSSALDIIAAAGCIAT